MAGTHFLGSMILKITKRRKAKKRARSLNKNFYQGRKANRVLSDQAMDHQSLDLLFKADKLICSIVIRS